MEPTFQCIVAAAAAQWPAHRLYVCVCVCLDSAVALSVASLTAAGGDPTRSFLGPVAGLELVGDCRAGSWKLELCSCRVLVCQHFWPPRTYINRASIHFTASLAKKQQPQRSTAQAYCTTEQDRTRQGTAHNNDNNNKTRLPCPNGKVAVCRCRLLYAGSSHFSWPHLANPSDVPQALVGDRQPAASQLNKRIGRQKTRCHTHAMPPPPKVFPGCGPPELHRLQVCWFLCCNLFPRSPPFSLACPVCPFLSRPAQSHPVQSSRAQSRSIFMSMCCQLQSQVP